MWGSGINYSSLWNDYNTASIICVSFFFYLFRTELHITPLHLELHRDCSQHGTNSSRISPQTRCTQIPSFGHHSERQKATSSNEAATPICAVPRQAQHKERIP